MASYTIKLRDLIEVYFSKDTVKEWFKDYNLADYLTPQQLQFMNEQTQWSKDKLANKIIDHYYMREIGLETPALFKHYAKVTMQEIMEKYAPLLYTQLLEYDILINENYTETFEGTTEGTTTGSSNSTSSLNNSNLAINSDTPQGEINKQEILNGTYASSTSATEGQSNGNDTTNTAGETEQKQIYSRTFKGNHGVLATYQKLIEQYRDNIKAYDNEIIKEVNSLFFGIY